MRTDSTSSRRNDQPAAVYSLGGLLSLRRTQVVQIQNNTGRTVRLVNDTRTRSRVRVPGRRRLAGRGRFWPAVDGNGRPNTLVRAAGREPAHPGAIVREDCLKSLGLSVTECAKREVTMSVNVEDKIRKLSPAQRKKVEARAAEFIAEEMTLRELRKARKLTQVRMAKQLGITQDSVSRLEKRSDLLLSTLRKTVEAMGGNLSLVAQFPDRAPVVLAGIAEDDPRG